MNSTGIALKEPPIRYSYPIEIRCAGKTDVGRIRSINQDHFLIADLHKNMHVRQTSVTTDQPDLYGRTLGKMLLVADGMGGANAGEVASEMAVRSIAEYLLNSMHWLFLPTQEEIQNFVKDLKRAANHSHVAVKTDADEHPDRRGMGTTLTVAYLVWPMLYVLHVGDSRCYILRDGKLQLLTKDQTLAQVLYDQGHLDEDDFQKSPYHHVLVNAIGAEAELEAVVYKAKLREGDRLLLCSDGVNAHLSDDEIETILKEEDSPQATCRRLVETTNNEGGSDNITSVVAFCESLDDYDEVVSEPKSNERQA